MAEPAGASGRSRVALVTGAGRGLGRELAVSLSAHGLSVGLVGRDPAALAATADDCAGASSVAVADVTDPAAVAAALAAVEADLGAVDLVVSNAGAVETAGELPWDTEPAQWRRVLDVNVLGAFTVLPGMVDRGRGRVLHLASGVGARQEQRFTAYAASKAALLALGDGIAGALTGTGVVLLAASPGLVRTDMSVGMWGVLPDAAYNPTAPMLEVARQLADGRLDALHGRFVHAVRDDVVALADDARLQADGVRTLRLRPYGPEDPFAG